MQLRLDILHEGSLFTSATSSATTATMDQCSPPVRPARSVASPQRRELASGSNLVWALHRIFVVLPPLEDPRLAPPRIRVGVEGFRPLALVIKHEETLRVQLRLGILQRRPRLRHAVQHFCAAATPVVILRIGLGLRRLCRVCLCRICL